MKRRHYEVPIRSTELRSIHSQVPWQSPYTWEKRIKGAVNHQDFEVTAARGVFNSCNQVPRCRRSRALAESSRCQTLTRATPCRRFSSVRRSWLKNFLRVDRIPARTKPRVFATNLIDHLLGTPTIDPAVGHSCNREAPRESISSGTLELCWLPILD